uniref:Uncharacterized protein n=1 Tax=Nelumbo nucifera TaxID=4432 RepID=A0A822Y0W9_NELNU|nr:TPA_asm: hypothetical protein HUJ06_026179 [Nelumbo nucifera]
MRGSCGLPDTVVGLEEPLEELKSELFRDGVKVLGVCKFRKKIFFLRVSNSPETKNLIKDVFKDIASNSLGDFKDDENAVNRLGEQLSQQKQEHMQLVLDDVWSDSDIEKLKPAFNTVTYKMFKMLITSRTELKEFDSVYKVKTLSHRNSIKLFCQLAAENGSLKVDDDLVEKVVKGCKGLPLVLNVIAKSLRREEPKIWEMTESILSKSSSKSIFDHHSVLQDRLAPSIELLDVNLRESFMDLGCFPEDRKIPASVLLDIWVELYKLDGENDAYDILKKLSNRNFVNFVGAAREDAGEIGGNLDELFVIQLDLLRELAIYRSLKEGDIRQSKRLTVERRQDDLPESWKKEEHQLLNAHLVSLHPHSYLAGEICPLEWCNMQFPEAKVLLDFLGRDYKLPPFIKKMEKLRTLIIANQGSRKAQLTGWQALSNLAQLKRFRLEKVLIPSLNDIKLCEVGEATRNCTTVISEMLPNLTEINIDYCNDLKKLPPGIGNVAHLKKLSITNCHDLSALPEEIGDLTELEVLRLHACTGLLQLPDSIQKLKKLRFLDVSDCLNMKKFPETLDELRGFEKELPESAKNLRHLKRVICDEETAIPWQPFQPHLPNLKMDARK